MLNGDIETDFEVDESSDTTLRVKHDGSANRPKITSQTINKTAFYARLTHVQYGTWRGEDAVILGFEFEFRYPDESLKRMIAASIRLTLEAVKDSTLSAPDAPLDPKNDPQIVLLAPGQVRGEIKPESVSRSWALQVPVKYHFFGLDIGVEGSLGQDTTVESDHRMWINGFSDSDDEHYEDNAVVWDTGENQGQKSGILHRFPAAVVAKLPKNPQHPVKLTGRVTPSVAYSLNPLRLRQKKDDPVFLDRLTGKGDAIAPGTDFGSADFPWDKIVHIPQEYSVCQETLLAIFADNRIGSLDNVSL